MTANALAIDSPAIPNVFQSQKDVRDFLRRHPSFAPLIEDVFDQIPRFFGDSAILTVRVTDDPEIENYDVLRVWIATPRGTMETHKLYRGFLEEWWLNNLPRAQGRIVVSHF